MSIGKKPGGSTPPITPQFAPGGFTNRLARMGGFNDILNQTDINALTPDELAKYKQNVQTVYNVCMYACMCACMHSCMYICM